ncbi:LuxR C-terminal-related transcriptional regulator [Pseudonocardia alaniniphila]|uniref:LuxR C-terminal-related transcriptional regulator n=1 Tax=Pseudonocardia alaniniphila TaxID=75291 RepID=A0ABS9TCR6_9PSEU|nr:LuxR family transcriptional regulator [Pseudonocardia alaniniphila]MCH6166336.1 LuxR C-terminal-related transcriptional regulator [Pseudonocardia alaniniphila]
MLLDRSDEREVLDRLLKAVTRGESRALVVRGELGVGKTALLDDLVGRASGCRVERVVGVQSELKLAFAGLYHLCRPMLGWAERLPGPQRGALYTAFGVGDGPAPDRFLVGLAVLGLLAEVARERPLVCVIDDAQWLDTASVQTLTFVARRLGVESVVVILAVREPHELDLSGLPELVVGGLPDKEARALLGSALRGPVDEQVLDRIVAESRGNPLALLELLREATSAELASGLLSGGTLPGRIDASYLERIVALPEETRRLLLVAAVEPVGDSVLVWRAAGLLGIGADAVAPAAAAGLIEIGARVRFPHPMVRAVVCQAASLEERQHAHRLLAEVTDSGTDPDRRAWHRGHGAAGPDEEIAAELERSAGRARARGGPAAAAALLERAAELTLEPARQAERVLAAAQARHQAGMTGAARGLLSLAESEPLDDLRRARAELLCAQIAFTERRGGDAPRLLLKVARGLEPLDVRLARETYLEGLSAAMFAGAGLREIAEAARAAPRATQFPGAGDLLLDAVATRLTDGYAAGVPMMRRALHAFRGSNLPEDEGLRWLWLASTTAAHTWDDGTWAVLADRYVRLARDGGALAVLPLALTLRTVVYTFLGKLPAAAPLIEEAEEATQATGSPPIPMAAMLVAAWGGRVAEAFRLINATVAEVAIRGEGFGLTVARWAEALLCNSLSRHDDAFVAASQVGDVSPPELGLSAWGILVELVEAAARSGRPEHAHAALQRLTETTRASGTDWALGVEARSRALVSGHEAADRLYREAISRLSRTHVRGALARAHLLYGEWLRRERRQADAREQFRLAHEMFTVMGARAFARRAARELQAAGEPVRRRSVDTDCGLSSREEQIARLVAAGLTNPEIAARLFLSPRTIEWHLTKIFGKLNIASRRQLRRSALWPGP